MNDFKALEHNIWKFYLYKFLRGLWIPATIWTIYLLARGFNYSQIGITDIIFAFVVLLFEIPSGAFADLIGRKYSVFFGYTIVGLSVFLVGFTGNYSIVLLLMAIYGLGETLYSGADNALIYDTLKELKKEEIYPKIDGRANSLFSIGSVIGGFVGVYLYTQNISFPYYVGGFVFFLAGVSFLLMTEPSRAKERYSLKSHYIKIIDGVKYAKNHTQIKWIILFSSLIAAMFGYQIFIVQPSLVSLGYDVKLLGLLFALIWGFEALVYWNAHKILDKIGEKKTLFLIATIHSVCFIVLSFIHFWFGLIFIIINYFGRGLFYPVTNNYAQKHTVSSHRATVLSVQSFSINVFGIIGTFVLSRLTDLFSIAKMYLFVGITTIVFAMILYLTYPKPEK
ncbi:MFS transporter [Candidatus Woesearchaeota archaeon]|nr:MFS transporter [Candidatus Woesearchaeota archaeon]